MKYINNKIQFEVGDWVYFLGNIAALCTTTWCQGLVLKVDQVTYNSLCFNDNRFFPNALESHHGFANAINQFRPATQEEIDSVLKKLDDPPIMLGKYEVKFGDERLMSTKESRETIHVGDVTVTEKQFKEIGKKAGWL